MINWNDIKNFDVTTVDLGRFDPTRLDLTRLDLRNVELPRLPERSELPKLPEVDVPVDQVVGYARDAAYATVGAVVVTAQKADERRRELTDQAGTRVRKLIDSVA